MPSKMLPSCPRAFVPANGCIAFFENLQKLEKVASTWFKNIQSITEATEKHARVTLVTFAAGPQRKDS